MELIEDVESYRDRVQDSIKKFGFAPDHNLEWFLTYIDQRQKPVVAIWPNGEVELAHQEEKAWYTFSEPLALQVHRGQRVAELADFIFQNYPNVGKVVTEAREDTRQQILAHLSVDYKIIDDSLDDYVLIWPIMNMEKYDPALPGGHFKSIRNAKNKFYREHKVEIKSTNNVSKQDLRGVVDRWIPIAQKREMEFLHAEPYYNLIEREFKGMTTSRAMIVDGHLVGFNAGWEIPNSKIFYAGVGIHDYSLRDLGLVLYLEDLEWIKNMGYKTVDMGGVEEGNQLNFKNQFLPESWYKTFVFSITKR